MFFLVIFLLGNFRGRGGLEMNVLLEYSWELFLTAELLSLGSLILFGLFRYLFNKARLGFTFIILFLLLLFAEGLLGLYVYQQTGEFSTFQIVIAIFILYACTFGIFDFIRLDRWMRKQIGKLRGVDLLTEKDYRIMERNKNPHYLAKKYRITSLIHLFIFVLAQAIFWSMGTDSLTEAKGYVMDLSWIQAGEAVNSPYPNDTLYGIGIIWGIVFIVDFIYSWSYTLFPDK